MGHFSAISWRDQVTFRYHDDVRFVLDQDIGPKERKKDKQFLTCMLLYHIRPHLSFNSYNQKIEPILND